MPVHSLFVESVDLRCLGGSSGGNNFLGHGVNRCLVAPGEKKLGPLARKGKCDSAADRAAGSVDHSVLILKRHGISPFLSRTVRPLLALVRSSALLHVGLGAGALRLAASFNINPAFCQ